MRFLGLLKADKESEAGAAPDPGLMERMAVFMAEVGPTGVLVDTNGLQPTSKGKRVKLQNGKVTVTDGPFTESKELVASYAVLETKTIEEAVYWTTRFLQVLGEGECEIRPIYGPDDFGGGCHDGVKKP